jgi:hypothetical protein
MLMMDRRKYYFNREILSDFYKSETIFIPHLVRIDLHETF